MNYFFHIFILIQLYVMLALSVNLMVGYTGLITLAHAAFYGVGAYICTLLMINMGLGFIPSIFIAAFGALLLSYFISYASLRFRGDYFIVVTLAFQIIVFTILYNWISVTRGPFGIPGIPRPSVAGISIDSISSFAIFGFVCMLFVLMFLWVIFRSPFSRTLQAIRDDEVAAVSLGKNALYFKIRSVAIASACAAIPGALYATYITYIDPTSFTLDESILIISMVIVGGTGNLKGPIVGAIVLVLMPEALRFLQIPDSVAANLRLIIYGLLLIVMMRYRPQGIAGKYQFE